MAETRIHLNWEGISTQETTKLVDFLTKYDSFQITLPSFKKMNLQNSSISKINFLTGNSPNDLINYVSYIIREGATKTTYFQKELNEEENDVYQKALDSVKKFHFFKPEDLNKEYEERAALEIPVPSKSWKKINAMHGNVYILADYTAIEISSLSYEEIRRNIVRVHYDKRIELIFTILRSFQFNPDGDPIEISSYSVKKILKLLDFYVQELIPYMNIRVRDPQHIQMFRKKTTLHSKSYIMEMKREQGSDDKLVSFSQTDINKRNPIHNLKLVEQNRQTISDFLFDLIKKIQDKKDKVNEILRNDKNKVSKTKDKEGNNCFIYKTIYDYIINDTTPFDLFIVKDINGVERNISKKELIKENEENNTQNYVKINNTAFLPIDVVENIFNEYDYYNQETQITPLDKDCADIEQQSIKIRDIDVNEYPEITIEGNCFTPEKEAQNELKTILSNETDAPLVNLIKTSKGVLIPQDTLTKLKNRNDSMDNGDVLYTYTNPYTNQKETITLNEVNDSLTNPNRYILTKTKDNNDDKIVNKDTLIKSVNDWTLTPNNTLPAKDDNDNDSEINPFDVQVIKFEPKEIPEQIIDINNNLKQQLNDIKANPNSTYTKYTDANGKTYYIRTNLRDNIINKDTPYDIYHIKDIENTPIKISKQTLKDNASQPQYIQISNKETFTKEYLPLDVIEKAINDNTSDKIENNDKHKTEFVKDTQDYNDTDNNILNNQPEQIKLDFINAVSNEPLYKINDTNYLRKGVLEQIKDHEQKTPFNIYHIPSQNENNDITITKTQVNDLLNDPKQGIYAQTKDNVGNIIYVNIDDIKNTNCGLDEEFISNGHKITLHSLKAEPLPNLQPLPSQPDEEKMLKLKDIKTKLINDINDETKSKHSIECIEEVNQKPILISKNYPSLITQKNSENDKVIKYKIKDDKDEEVIVDKEPKIQTNNTNEYIEIKNNETGERFSIAKNELLSQIDTLDGNDNIDTPEKDIIISVNDFYTNNKVNIPAIDIIVPEPSKELSIEPILPEGPSPEEIAKIMSTKNKLLKRLNSEEIANKINFVKTPNNGHISQDSLIQMHKRNDPKNEGITYKFTDPCRNKEEEITLDDVESSLSQPDRSVQIQSQGNNILTNKENLINAINKWNNLSDKIQLTNETDNTNIEVDPNEIDINVIEPKPLPKQKTDYNNELKHALNEMKHKAIIIKYDKPTNKSQRIRLNLAKKILNKDTTYDRIHIKDISGKPIKISKKILKQSLDEPDNQFITITNNVLKENLIIPISDLEKALNDNKNDTFNTKDIGDIPQTLNKSSIQIVNDTKNYDEEDEATLNNQPEQFKIDIINSIKEYLLPVEDLLNHKYQYLREAQLKQVNEHQQTVPFNKYILTNYANITVTVNKKIVKDSLLNPHNQKYFLCKDKGNNSLRVILEKDVKETDCGFDENFYSNNNTFPFKNLSVAELEPLHPLPKQKEEIKMEYLVSTKSALQDKLKTSKKDLIECPNENNKGTYVLINKKYVDKIKQSNRANPKAVQYKIKNDSGNEIIVDKEPKYKNENELFIKVQEVSSDKVFIVSKRDFANKVNGFDDANNLEKEPVMLVLKECGSKKDIPLKPEDIEIIDVNDVNADELFIEPIIKAEEKIQLVTLAKIIDPNEKKDVIGEQPQQLQQQQPPKKRTFKIRRAVVNRVKKG